METQLINQHVDSQSNITPSCTNIIVGAYCGEPALYCVSFHYHTTKRSTTLNMFVPYSFSLASSWPAQLYCGRDQKGQHSGKQQPHYCKQCSQCVVKTCLVSSSYLHRWSFGGVACSMQQNKPWIIDSQVLICLQTRQTVPQHMHNTSKSGGIAPSLSRFENEDHIQIICTIKFYTKLFFVPDYQFHRLLHKINILTKKTF